MAMYIPGREAGVSQGKSLQKRRKWDMMRKNRKGVGSLAYQILHPRDTKIEGVLFDMDGVILDSEKLYAKFWAAGCAFYGYNMNYQQALGMRSLSAEAGQAYLSSLFGPDIVYSQVRAKRIELMDAYIEENGIEAKPGVYALLDVLEEKKIPFAITTASPADRIEDHLTRLNLYHRFPIICSAHAVAHGKPEPDIYLYGAKAAELPGIGGQLYRAAFRLSRRVYGIYCAGLRPAGSKDSGNCLCPVRFAE